MKIAQIDVNYGQSSTGKIVEDLCNCFSISGNQTLACYGRGSNSDIKNAHKISNDIEVGFHVLATRLTGYTGNYSTFATKRLIKLLKSFQPDIVHMHDLHGYYLNIGEVVSFLKINNIPTVWTFHCEFMYTGKCGHAHDCVQWKTHCKNCPQLQEYPKSWFFDQTFEMFDQKYRMFQDFNNLHLVAPSEWLADRMKESIIVGNKEISVVPNGLDTSTFLPKENPQLLKDLNLKNDFIALSVGSNFWSDAKGGSWIIKLAKMMPDISFLIIGEKSIPASIPKNLRILPPFSNQKTLANYYSFANVLLLTSLKETFSMVTAESLACGTPVLGFDSGAPKTVAPPGYGNFVTYGDINALKSELYKLKKGKSSYKSAIECHEFASKMYAKEVMASKYEQIYRKLLKKDQLI